MRNPGRVVRVAAIVAIVRVLDLTEGDLRPFGVPREGAAGRGSPPPAAPSPAGRGGGGH